MVFAERLRPYSCLAWALLLFGCADLLIGRADAQFAASAKWVPESANSLVLVQAKRIFESPLSKSAGWKKDQLEAFKSGVAFLPATTERVLISAQLDLDSMQPIWKVSVFEKYGPEISLGKLSDKTGGNIELLNGRNAVILPNDTYLIQMDDTTLAAMSPANRQATARWLRSKAGAAAGLSTYLERSLTYSDKNADVIWALDLEQVIEPEKASKALKGSGIVPEGEIKSVAESLTAIQGMMLGITVSDKITGALRLDSSSDMAVLVPYAKQLIIEALSRRGAMIDDLEDWNLTQSGTSVVLAGPLSESGFRQVLSLVRHSIQQDLTAHGPSEASASSVEITVATRSKQYFAELEAIFEGIKKLRGRSLNIYASYFERYAREIDELSVVDIDEDLVKFGTFVSDNFRDVSGVLRDSQFTRRSLQAGMQDSYYTERYGVYGNYSYHFDNGPARRAIGVQQDVAGESAAREIMRNVSKQMGEVRRGLSTKYKINF